MHTDVQSRGFSLTPAVRAAVDHEARDYARRFPKLTASLKVRLFDVNGRGGPDKGCLVHARVGANRMNVVASVLDADLHRAINAAFVKLERSTRIVLGRGLGARQDSSERQLRGA